MADMIKALPEGGRKQVAAAADVKADRPPGRYRVAKVPGLYLLVRPTKAKFWVLRYMLRGKAREMGLGPASWDGKDGGVTLAAAKDAAARQRAIAREGMDPVETRHADEAVKLADRERTFEAAALAFIASRASAWKNEKHRAQWTSTLKAHAFPKIGAMPVREIATRHVLDVLEPIWTTTPETASRVRGRIENVLDSARAAGWIDRDAPNPARWSGHLEMLLPAPRKVAPVIHHPALDFSAAPAFMAVLGKRVGISALCLRFAVLTAARSGEARQATWGEIDLKGRAWTVPGVRMKARKVHRVPLSDAALAVLKEAAEFRTDQGADAPVFPGPRKGQSLSDMALSMLVRGMALDGLKEGETPRWRDAEGRAVTAHGMRACFKGWTLARGFPDHLSEAALAHVDRNKVRAAYARDDLVEERRPMMEAWARFLGGEAASVVPLAKRRSA